MYQPMFCIFWGQGRLLKYFPVLNCTHVAKMLNVPYLDHGSKAQSIRVKKSPRYEPDVIFCVYREIQKLVAFLVVLLGAYLCQIFKEINLISLGSFAFLVHVLIQKLQDLDRMPIKKCSTIFFYFPLHTKSHFGSFPDDVWTCINWA